MLPLEVQQAMGLQQPLPVPADDGSAAMPQIDPYGGLHPAVANALGLVPAASPATDDPTAGLPPLPPQQAPPLPSFAEPQQPQIQAPPPVSQVAAQPGVVVHPEGTPMPPQPQLAKPTQQRAPAQPSIAQMQAQANAAQTQAEVDAQKANADATAVKAAEATAQVANYDEAKAKRDALIADQQRAADDFAKTHMEKQMAVDAIYKQASDYKVDQDKYWREAGAGTHMGWYVALALSELGNAMQRKSGPNPVLQMLQDKMHQAVVAQVDQRDQLLKQGDRAEHQLDKYDAFSKDRQAIIQARMGELDHALAQNVMATAARFGTPTALANGQAEAAKLEQSAAEHKEQATIRAATIQHQRAEEGIAAGHLSLATKQFTAEYGPQGFKQQDLDLRGADEARKAAADAAKASKDAKKTQAEEGVYNPLTGNALYNDTGKKMVADANRKEAQARYASPQDAQRLKAEALELRDNAKSEVATIHDVKTRSKVQDVVDYGQSVYEAAAEIRDFLKSDPDMTDRGAFGKLQSKWGSLIKDEIKSFGANASSREFDAVSHHILNFDPNSIWDRTFKKTPTIGQLEGLMEETKKLVNLKLHGAHVKDGWLPTSPLENEAPKFSGATVSESTGDNDARRPAILRGLKLPGGIEDPYAQDARIAAESRVGPRSPTGRPGQPSQYGMDPNDEAIAIGLVEKAKGLGDSDYSQIVSNLASTIGKSDQNGEIARPSLSTGLLNLVRDRDPVMYKDVVSQLADVVGAQKAQELTQFDNKFDAQGHIIQPPGGSPIPPEVLDAINQRNRLVDRNDRNSFVRGKGKLDEEQR